MCWSPCFQSIFENIKGKIRGRGEKDFQVLQARCWTLTGAKFASYAFWFFLPTWKRQVDFSLNLTFPFPSPRFIFILFSFSDFLRTYYASNTGSLFPKFLCSKSSNSAPSCIVLSTHHQTSLRNKPEISACSLNVNKESIKLVINPARYNTVKFCRTNTFQWFSQPNKCVQLNMHLGYTCTHTCADT